jgi:hypothetical protein
MIFEAHPRVVRLEVDGEEMIVPLVLVLFLIATPYKDRQAPIRCGKERRLRIEWWDQEEPVVWARNL